MQNQYDNYLFALNNQYPYESRWDNAGLIKQLDERTLTMFDGLKNISALNPVVQGDLNVIRQAIERFTATAKEAVQSLLGVVKSTNGQKVVDKITSASDQVLESIKNAQAAVKNGVPQAEVNKAIEKVKDSITKADKTVVGVNKDVKKMEKDAVTTIKNGNGATVKIVNGNLDQEAERVKKIMEPVNKKIREVNEVYPILAMLRAETDKDLIVGEKMMREEIQLEKDARIEKQLAKDVKTEKQLVKEDKQMAKEEKKVAKEEKKEEKEEIKNDEKEGKRIENEYNQKMRDWEHGKLKGELASFRQFRDDADFNKYAHLLKFFEWHEKSGWKMNDFPAYFMWKMSRRTNGDSYREKHRNDFRDWKYDSDFDDLFGWMKWREWKKKKDDYKRHNRNKIPRIKGFNRSNYHRDGQYAIERRRCNLKDHTKYHRYCDWVEHCAITGTDVTNMHKFKEWKLKHKKEYDPRKYEKEWDERKKSGVIIDDWNDYLRWNEWKQWKNLKNCCDTMTYERNDDSLTFGISEMTFPDYEVEKERKIAKMKKEAELKRAAKIANREAAGATRAVKADNQVAKVDNLKAKVTNKEAKVDNLEAKVANRNAKVANEKAKAANEKAKVANRVGNAQEAKVADQNAKVANQKAKDANRIAKACDRNAKIDNRDAKIDNRNAKIDNRDAKIDNRNAKADNRGVKIDNREAKIDNRAAKVNNPAANNRDRRRGRYQNEKREVLKSNRKAANCSSWTDCMDCPSCSDCFSDVIDRVSAAGDHWTA